jgi:hypothetical protein
MEETRRVEPMARYVCHAAKLAAGEPERDEFFYPGDDQAEDQTFAELRLDCDAGTG